MAVADRWLLVIIVLSVIFFILMRIYCISIYLVMTILSVLKLLLVFLILLIFILLFRIVLLLLSNQLPILFGVWLQITLQVLLSNFLILCILIVVAILCCYFLRLHLFLRFPFPLILDFYFRRILVFKAIILIVLFLSFYFLWILGFPEFFLLVSFVIRFILILFIFVFVLIFKIAQHSIKSVQILFKLPHILIVIIIITCGVNSNNLRLLIRFGLLLKVL